MSETILKVIVGSQAHGLATPESDFDYRGVFVVPTEDILKIGSVREETRWIEGKEDDTSWEIGKFLTMASKCNPTVLETFLSPLAESSEYSYELQSLFSCVWNSTDVMNAFIGYGHNQRKKFFEDKDKRRNKYAAAHLRTLYNAWELLSTGIFTIRIADTEVGDKCRAYKNGQFEIGEVIQTVSDWEEKVREAYTKNPDKKTDIDKINEFLLKVRKEKWQN